MAKRNIKPALLMLRNSKIKMHTVYYGGLSGHHILVAPKFLPAWICYGIQNPAYKR